MKETLSLILQRLDTISDDVSILKTDMADVKGDVGLLKTDVGSLSYEQSEMRAEMMYYYSKMTENLDNAKVELKSEIRQVIKVQQQHQDVLEFINKNQ